MPKAITREHLKERLDHDEDFVLVNVLSPETFEKGRVPCSINVPLPELEENAPELWPDKDKDIIVYCASYACDASPRAAELLEDLGYANITVFKGGLTDWEDADYEAERGSAAA